MAEQDPATAFAQELAKQLPVKQVYDDAAAPGARQIGATIEDLVKVIRLVGFPVQYLAAVQDRYRAFLERSVAKVAHEDRVPPPPQILGPVLEGLRYEIHDGPIVDMFDALLSASMDKNRVKEAHPSYPNLIRQLSSDEARLLDALADKDIEGEAIYLDGNDPFLSFKDHAILQQIEQGNIDFYAEHLLSLSLVALRTLGGGAHRRQLEGGFADTAVLGLSPLGRRFMSACRPRKQDDEA